ARHVEEHVDAVCPYQFDDLGIRHLADVVPYIGACAKALGIGIIPRAAVVNADTEALLPEVLQGAERHESHRVPPECRGNEAQRPRLGTRRWAVVADTWLDSSSNLLLHTVPGMQQHLRV